MKIGVLSDTHVPGIYPLLPAVVWKALEECDRLIHTGDLDEWETYELLKSQYPIDAVAGNCDKFFPCEEVPEEKVIEVGGFRLGMTHGRGPAKGLAPRVLSHWASGAVDLLIFGHSHLPGEYHIEGQRMLNPGSATDLLAERQTLAILHLDEQIQISHIDLVY
jgi:putative phosphoesterase